MIRLPYTNKPALGSNVNWKHPLSQGLLHCLLFNGSGGLQCVDAARTIGYAAQGDAYVNGSGLYCPGTNGAVSILSTRFTDNMSNYTVVASIRTKSPANNDRIFDKNRWYLLWTTGGNLTSSRTAAGGNANTVTTGGLIPTGVRKSVAASFTGADNLIRIYVDGKEATYSTQTAGVPAYTGDQTTNIHVGKSNINGAYWDGEIHYAYVYDRVLSVSEIAAIHQNPYQMINQRRLWFPYVSSAGPTNSGMWIKVGGIWKPVYAT